MAAQVELFDHTADIGIRITATSRTELVVGAIRGLYTVIGELQSEGEKQNITFHLSGEDDAVLLRDFLNEVLFLFEQKRQLVTSPEVRQFGNGRLHVVAAAQGVDGARSRYDREVKAVTYHELAVRPVAQGWEATVIVDI